MTDRISPAARESGLAADPGAGQAVQLSVDAPVTERVMANAGEEGRSWSPRAPLPLERVAERAGQVLPRVAQRPVDDPRRLPRLLRLVRGLHLQPEA